MSTKKHSLIGKYFHTYPNNGKGERRRCWQGQVLAQPQRGFYLVQIYCWVDGSPADEIIVPFRQMVDDRWDFFDTHEDWLKTGEAAS